MLKKSSIFCLFFLCGCGTKTYDPGCVVPPPQTMESEKSAAVKVAADLNQFEIDAEFEASWKDKVNVVFSEVKEDDLALYLLLKAIECMREDPETRKLLAEVVKQRWAQEKGISGTELAPSPIELEYINQGRFSDYIISELMEYDT